MWTLDLAFADVVSTSTDPRLGAIRLAWWRDRLAELDGTAPIAGEPRLSAIRRHLLAHANGAMLSALPIAWAIVLQGLPWDGEVADAFRERGRLLFGIGARVLGGASAAAEPAGALWSLVDGALHCSDPASRAFLFEQAREDVRALPRAVPRELRPLTVLGALAAADALGRRSPARAAGALWHRLTGRFPS